MDIKKTDLLGLNYKDLLNQINEAFEKEGQGQAQQGLSDQSKNPAGASIDLPQLARELVSNNIRQFAGLFGQVAFERNKKIKRVYSKEEIRKIVLGCLIEEYQIPDIINAVTDYLFDLIDME